MLNKKHGITIVVIEHHTEFIADYCKQVVLMDEGSIIWKKDTAEAVRLVDHLLTRQIYPPQVTQAAVQSKDLLKQEYPITVTEALDTFPYHESVQQNERSEARRVG